MSDVTDPPSSTASDDSDSAIRDVFISYSSRDKSIADAICAMLEADKVRCWIAPRDILPGVSYGEAIINGINVSRAMVIVLSAASNGSQQVLREVERAVSKGIPIVPFRIEDIVPSKSMEFFLSAPHWLDALTKPVEAHIKRLSSVVRAVLDSGGPREGAGQTPGRQGEASRQPFRAKLAGWLATAIVIVSNARQRLSLVPRRVLRLWAGAGVALFILIAVLIATRTDRLKSDYKEYQESIRTGRGSGFFFERAAPLRYADWRGRAESGDPVAELFVGRCYQEGIIVGKDYATANAWFEKAAAKGNDYALVTLGWAYERGEGVKVDRSEALRWYTRAADHGNADAMAAIGDLYAAGINSPPDPVSAFAWYRKAADRGYTMAMRLIGDDYLYGTGVEKNAAESDRWYKRAADSGDAYMIGKFFGNRLAPHFAAYLAAGASEAAKASSLSALRELRAEYLKLDFSNMASLFSASELNTATNGIGDLKSEDPLRQFYDELIQKYTALYSAAPQSRRKDTISGFSQATSPVLERWYSDQRYADVATFWEQSYKDISLADLKSSGEFDSLIRELKFCISSLLRTGKSQEASDVLRNTLDLCDWTLQQRSWDWYFKDAYCNLCFETASTWVEIGEHENAQPLLKRAWGVCMKQYGKEALLSRYSQLPLKGKFPDGATGDDHDFFERFAPGNTKKSGMVRFTVPCDFSGKKYPFFVYIMTGPRGYAELQDQFRWVSEMRGGEISAEVRGSFLRLNKIAVENNVDYMDLCVYALGTEGKEDAAKKTDDKAKN